MYMRRASRACDRLVVEVLREFAGEELAGVVEVKLANDAYALRLGLADVANGVELGDEGLDPSRGFVLVFQEVDLLEARVIVDEHEEVREAVLGPFERSSEVAVDQPPYVRRSVGLARVRYPRCVGDFAVCAVECLRLGDVGGNVARGASELPDEVVSDV